MKLRIKASGADGAWQHRLELPGPHPACTLGALCGALEGLGAAQPVSLSLNKRDPLIGEPDAPLKDLGVCNGDLLWLLSAPPPAGAAAPAASPASGTAETPSVTAQPAAGLASPSHAKRIRGEESSQGGPQEEQQQPQHRQDKGKQAAGAEQAPAPPDVEMAADGDDPPLDPQQQEGLEEEALPAGQRVPTYLLRTLRASGAFMAGPSPPASLLVLAAHAAMLETGFVPSWAAQPPQHQQQQAGEAQQAGQAGMEAGQAGVESGGPSSVFEVPASAWVSGSICRIEYHLVPPDNGAGSSGGSEEEAGERGSAAAGMDVDAVEPAGVAAGAPAQQQQQQEGGGQEEAAGQEQAQGPACTLQCSSLGGGAAVLAASTQSHSRHLALQAAAFLTPLPQPGTAASGSGGAGPSGSSGAGSSSASAEQAGAGPASASGVELLPGGDLALGGALLLGWRTAGELWRRLKDGLAFPMLLAAYAEAGLQPPAGLLALPEELKEHLLGLLQAPDLAALACTCSELRHLVSLDELWRPLLDRDFPHQPAWIAEQARHRGCKWAYGQCVRDRKRREDEMRRARARAFMPAVPRFGVPHPPPFYPPPPPPGFPRMIGGDYDRLPGGGQFGGGAPGGLFFGSGRQQGRGGGAGGFRLH